MHARGENGYRVVTTSGDATREAGADRDGAPLRLDGAVERPSIHGLDEVGLEARLAGAAAIVSLAVARERDEPDACPLRRRSNAPRQLVAVQAGQPEVDQGDLGARPKDEL